MTQTSEQLIFGTDYLKPKQTTNIRFADRVYGGVCPGDKTCIRKKADGNEDAMGMIRLPNGHAILLVADSHFGALASKEALSRFSEVFNQTSGSPDQRLFETHLRLDKLVRKTRQTFTPINCSTTLISVYVEPGTAWWCNTGDSHLMLHRNGNLQMRSEHHPALFVGDDMAHSQHVFNELERLGVTDVMTDPDNLHPIAFKLSQLGQDIRSDNADSDQIKQIIDQITKLADLDFPIPTEAIAQPWHELHQIMQYAPHHGRFLLHEGDRLLLASDGIDADVSGIELEDIETVLNKHTDIEDTAKALLKAATTRKGCNDNLMFLLAAV